MRACESSVGTIVAPRVVVGGRGRFRTGVRAGGHPRYLSLILLQQSLYVAWADGALAHARNVAGYGAQSLAHRVKGSRQVADPDQFVDSARYD